MRGQERPGQIIREKSHIVVCWLLWTNVIRASCLEITLDLATLRAVVDLLERQ